MRKISIHIFCARICVLLMGTILFSCSPVEYKGRQEMRLASDWYFVPDSLFMGDSSAWWQSFPVDSAVKVTVPHTWNIMEGLEDYAGTGWYYRLLDIPAGRGMRHYLHFEAVYHDAVVYVNGRKVGEHLNSGYLPFNVDITDALKGGSNRLVVRVSNRYSNTMLPYKRSFDWANDGGIIRPVTLFSTHGNLMEQMAVTPDTAGTATFRVCLDRPFEGDGQLVVSVHDPQGEELLEQNFAVREGTREIIGSFAVEGPELWHFDRPELYTLCSRLIEDGNLIDNKDVRFGYRKLEVKGDSMYLNGEPVRVAGIEWMPGSNPRYGMAEPEEYIDSVLQDMKEVNCVLTRFHWPQGEYTLSRMDEMGFLVQEEIPWWQQPTTHDSVMMAVHRQQIQEMVESQYNHPCIIAWGLGNEVSGYHPGTRKDFIELQEYTRRFDSCRLVNLVSSTLLRRPAEDISTFSDILTYNEYLGTWQGKRRERLPGVLSFIRKEVPGRAMIITEAGLCEPVFAGGDPRRIDDMRYHFNEWGKYPWIAGCIYFSLNDYRTQMGEDGTGRYRSRVHGISDLYRVRKASFNVCRALCSPVSLGMEKIKSGPSVRITVNCRNTLPSYAIKDYVLEIVYPGRTQQIKLPELSPGQEWTCDLETVPVSYRILRPGNYIVLDGKL